MCGRYTLSADPGRVRDEFSLSVSPNLPPRYNIAPTQDAPVITMSDGKTFELSLMRWGLVPSWAKSVNGHRGPIINARAETVSKRRAFQESFSFRRCLVPSDGFYEWKAVGDKKRPYYISLRNKTPCAFAGIWDLWCSSDGDLLHSFSIITVEANPALGSIHNRMPLLLDDKQYEYWLNAEVRNPNCETLRYSALSIDLEVYEVSYRVNNYANDDAMCIEPLPNLERHQVGRI